MLGGVAVVKKLAPFVGRSRMLLVEGLVGLFDEVRSSGRSHWVSLEAPTGWGKTRVGKRFYAALAARQKPPLYWPASLGETSRGELKVVAPKGKREEGSLPEFLWWGISCSSDGKSSASALREGVNELDSHSQYVSIACRKNRPIGEKAINKARSETWDFVKASAMGGFEAVIGTTLGVAVPGMGLAVLAGRKMASHIRSHLSDSRLVAEASELGASSRGLVEDLVQQLGQLGNAGFPVVLFVEDVHFADEALVEALSMILRRVSHLLVVTSAWLGEIDKIPELSRLAQEMGERGVRVRHEDQAGEPFPPGAGLMELEGNARRKIVLDHYPNADPITVTLLANRYINPGVLDRVCSMPGYEEAFGEQGNLYMSPEEINNLPRMTEELYRAHWNQLPEEAKLRHAIAARISPAAINSDAGAGYHTWSSPVLENVLNSLRLPNTADLSNAIEATIDADGWVTHVDEYLRRWSEIDQHHIATAAGGNMLVQYRKEDKQILTAVADVVTSGASLNPHAARTIVALYAAGLIAETTPVIKAVAISLGDLGYDDTAIPERVRLYEQYLTLAKDTSKDKLTDVDVHFNGIDAIAASGRYVRAIEGYRCLYKRTMELLGADDRRTLKALYNLAVNLYHARQSREAIRTFEQVCARLHSALGEYHTETLNALFGLAEVLESVGRGAEALDIFERVLEGRILVHGDGHPETSASRHRLSHALILEGRGLDAMGVLERVVIDRVDALGEDHPETLTARIDLAAATTGLKAIEAIKAVLVDRVRVLGENHRDTWKARDSLAEAYQDVGQWDEAIAVHEQIATARASELGEDHPDTLDAKCRHAHKLRDRDKQVCMLQQVVTVRARVLGSDHPDTIDTREQAACSLLYREPRIEKERLEKVFDELNGVLDARIIVFGEDHPDTLATRGHIAYALSQMGKLEDALALYDNLIIKTAEVRGAGHESKYVYLGWKATVLKDAGRTEDAITVHRQSLRDHVEMLGERHPDTMEERETFASVLSTDGQFPESISICRQVIDDRIAVHGEHHESVSSSRRMLAAVLVDAIADEQIVDDEVRIGWYSEAIATYKQIVDDEVRMHGETHILTLNARRMLGSVLRDAGRIDDAIAVLEQTLKDCTTVRGDQDYETGRVRNDLAEALMQQAHRRALQ